MKKRLLLTACMLCMFATPLFVLGLAPHANADASPLADGSVANAILISDTGNVPTETDRTLEWTYGDDDDVISYTFRPQHGDTAFYTVYKNGEGIEEFAVKYIGDTAMLYEVKNDDADLEKPFKVNSLKAYLKTLKQGDYSLNVTVPGGQAPDSHSHWWNDDGEESCGITYSEAALDVVIKVKAYELNQSNVGENKSADASVPVRYTVLTPDVLYTGEADNLPQIELTFDTSDGRLTLEQGEDFTLSSDTVNAGNAQLTIIGVGGFTGTVTIQNAYRIAPAENSVSDVYVVRWKYGEYDRNVNRFTANVHWGEDNLYFSVATDTTGSAESLVDGLDDIRLTDGVVSTQVEQLLNELDANTTYYLYAKVDGCNNYYDEQAYSQFEVVEVTNTWTTTPNVVSWEWHGFDENVNAIRAVPAFGDSVRFAVYTKDGDEYAALRFGGKDSFELEKDGDGYKTPADVVRVLSDLDAGTYYLFASAISNTNNYSSINEEFDADALVPFRVLQARNYWTQIPKISNWAYGGYNSEVNVITAAAAHGSAGIRYRIYKQTENDIGLLNFDGTTSFTINAEGEIPAVVAEGLRALQAGKYYLRAEVAATDNYTGLLENVADFSELPSFEVIKAENYWSTAPAINAWAEGNYTNEDNIPVAAAHYGSVRIVIVDVDDEENIVYDSENNINRLSEAGVGAYLLTATVAGTDNYGELSFDTIFHVFVPETAKVGIAWWIVLIIVICSLGVLVFIFWLLHDKGVLQLLTGKTIVAMRTRATMEATIASVRANKVAEEARESIRLAEELERLEAEKAESEKDDSDDEEESILIERDEITGFATFVRYKKPFSVKLIQASNETKDYYSRLKNVLLSYKKVKSKLSNSYDSFNKGRNRLAKLVIRGKSLCLYLPLDPDDYVDTKYKVERSESKKFAEVPCLYRIKSARRLGYAEELIGQACEKLGIVQGEIQEVDYRPRYESTERLLKKGLIRKITYTRKISNVTDYNQVSSAEAKTNDGSELARQEAAALAPDAESEIANNAEEQTKDPDVPEEAPVTTKDTSPAEKNDENSGTGKKKRKKQQGAK